VGGFWSIQGAARGDFRQLPTLGVRAIILLLDHPFSGMERGAFFLGRKRAMKDILKEERFDFVSSKDKSFILAFNNEMTRLGYGFGGKIGI
jgi:hypothetical protein